MDVTRGLPSAEEILRLLGGQQRNSGSDLLSEFLIFGAGVLVGAGIAMLLTPVPGSELRDDVAELVKRAAEKLSPAEHPGDGQGSENA